jgi:hypothetical protein
MSATFVGIFTSHKLWPLEEMSSFRLLLFFDEEEEDELISEQIRSGQMGAIIVTCSTF